MSKVAFVSITFFALTIVDRALDFWDKFNEIKSTLPHFEELERKPNNPSMTIVFDSLSDCCAGP